MKRVFLFAFVALIVMQVSGQVTFDDLMRLDKYGQIDLERRTIEFESDPMEATISFDLAVALMNKDVFTYCGLSDAYQTPLQRQAYMKTTEYAADKEATTTAYKDFMNTKFCISYNLRYNKPYDVENHCFKFRIGTEDFHITTTPGYIGLGNNLCVSFPTNRVTATKTRGVNYDGLFISQYIKTPSVPTDIALQIEKDMENPYCRTSLVFVVKPVKVSRETRTVNYGGYVGRLTSGMDYLLWKTVGLYIVDRKNEKILCDFSKIFMQTK